MDVYSWFRRRKSSSISNGIEIKHEDEEFFGVTDQVIDFIKSFTLDTFRSFSLPEEEADKIGRVEKDLSEWQEKHATLILSKVKELSQIRFRLCPGYLKERDFWRIYFSLVKTVVAEYELRAIRLEKLKEMATHKENPKKTGACEVEMLETKQTTDRITDE